MRRVVEIVGALGLAALAHVAALSALEHRSMPEPLQPEPERRLAVASEALAALAGSWSQAPVAVSAPSQMPQLGHPAPPVVRSRSDAPPAAPAIAVPPPAMAAPTAPSGPPNIDRSTPGPEPVTAPAQVEVVADPATAPAVAPAPRRKPVPATPPVPVTLSDIPARLPMTVPTPLPVEPQFIEPLPVEPPPVEIVRVDAFFAEIQPVPLPARPSDLIRIPMPVAPSVPVPETRPDDRLDLTDIRDFLPEAVPEPQISTLTMTVDSLPRTEVAPSGSQAVPQPAPPSPMPGASRKPVSQPIEQFQGSGLAIAALPAPLPPATPPLTAAPTVAPRPVPDPAPVAPEPPPQADLPSAPPQPAVDTAALRGAYGRSLSALIERRKTYPRAARRRGDEGAVRMRFTLDQSGRVIEAGIERASGSRVLDRAALDLIRNRIGQFPPPPPELGLSPAFSIEIAYTLR